MINQSQSLFISVGGDPDLLIYAAQQDFEPAIQRRYGDLFQQGI
jgi:hypothetical protein